MKGQLQLPMVMPTQRTAPSTPSGFVYEDEVAKEMRLKDQLYRQFHDAYGNYFPKPNRRQRRHIARTWKRR